MTIEEKAKAYDEALKKAKQFHDKDLFAECNGNLVEYIFPELAESEDERIRKEIQRVIEQLDKDTTICGKKYDYNKWLSWLEKQGNPADKIEPKFKNGQWIVFNGLTLYVNEVVQGYYRTTSIGGIPNSYDWNIDNAARLWTIQEAKDGDVLCYETKNELRIFIYKNGHVHYHCCYYNGHLTIVDSYFIVEKYLLCYIHPATIKQRDLFFQKIREAGYVWDAEKNELRKMEQKPKWSEEDEELLQHCCGAVAAADYYTIEDKEEMENWLKSLKQRKKEL